MNDLTNKDILNRINSDPDFAKQMRNLTDDRASLYDERNKSNRPENREHIYILIDEERDYQDTKWKGIDKSYHRSSLDRSIDEFALYILSYADELKDICRKTDNPNEKLDIVRKIASLAVACGEKHGMPKR